MKSCKIFFFVFSVSIFFIFFLLPANAGTINIGISPPKIHEDSLLKGSSFEKEITLSKSSLDSRFRIRIEVDESMEGWINVGEKEFIFEKGIQVKPVKFNINVPEDAEYGLYESSIDVKANMPGDINSNTQVILPVDVRLNVTDKKNIDYSIERINIPPAVEGSPINVTFRLDNDGNIKARPSSMEVVIEDKYRSEKLGKAVHESFPYAEPFTETIMDFSIKNTLPADEYWAVVKAYDEEEIIAEEDIIFRIVPAEKEQRNFPAWAYALIGAFLVIIVFIFHKALGRKMKQPALLLAAYLLIIAVMLDASIAAPPSVGIVSSEDSINPVSGSTRTATCNATLTDEDGYENITLATGRLFDGDSAGAGSNDDNNNHYTDSSCALTGGSGNTVYAECSFDLWYYANPGSNWECNITATDNETTDSASTGGTIILQELKAMTATSLEFDDGSGGPISLGSTSSQETMTINNTGNTDINVKVNGNLTAMTCDSGSIPLDNERYNITEGFAYDQGIQLTDTATTVEGLTVTQRTDDSTPSLDNIYWLLRMPINGVGGDCVGLITLNAD